MEQTTSLIIPPRTVSIGGADIKRLLPYRMKRMVGPFIYFDHFPPAMIEAGHGMDVHPHPHIGLSTLSYLLEGRVLHHDSLDNRQLLEPGDVNWMTAGKGIAHSERTPSELRDQAHRMHLLQFWVALPKHEEDREPSFTHHPKETIPSFTHDGAAIRLIAGSAFGKKSPVQAFSKLFFMDVQLPKGNVFSFDPKKDELAFYVLKGKVIHGEDVFPELSFVVLPPEDLLHLEASEDAQFVVLGGEAFPEPRYIFWNFVSSSEEKIEKAKAAWSAGDFPQVPQETDNVPLPAPKKS
jgi:hypothetical protein